MTLCPNGDYEDSKGHVAIFLSVRSAQPALKVKKVKFVFIVGRRRVRSIKKSINDLSPNGYGRTKEISLVELFDAENQHLQGESLYIHCEVTFSRNFYTLN
jgi:hypothetical protein